MEERSWTGIFVGYATVSKGYRVYDPRTEKVETSRDVRFSENETYYPVATMSGKFQDEGRGAEPDEVEFHSIVTTQSQGVSKPPAAQERRQEAEQASVSEEVEQQHRQEEAENRIETVELRRSRRVRWAPEKLTASEMGELHSVQGYCLLAVT